MSIVATQAQLQTFTREVKSEHCIITAIVTYVASVMQAYIQAHDWQPFFKELHSDWNAHSLDKRLLCQQDGIRKSLETSKYVLHHHCIITKREHYFYLYMKELSVNAITMAVTTAGVHN